MTWYNKLKTIHESEQKYNLSKKDEYFIDKDGLTWLSSSFSKSDIKKLKSKD